MSRRLATLVAYLIAGLGCRAQPDHVTAQGVRVWDDYGLANYNEIDLVIAKVIKAAPFGRAGMATWLDGARMHVSYEPYYLGGDMYANGFFDWHPHRFGVVAKSGPCPIGVGALAHELLHGMLFVRDGDADTDHASRAWEKYQPALDAAARRACDEQ